MFVILFIIVKTLIDYWFNPKFVGLFTFIHLFFKLIFAFLRFKSTCLCTIKIPVIIVCTHIFMLIIQRIIFIFITFIYHPPRILCLIIDKISINNLFSRWVRLALFVKSIRVDCWLNLFSIGKWCVDFLTLLLF